MTARYQKFKNVTNDTDSSISENSHLENAQISTKYQTFPEKTSLMLKLNLKPPQWLLDFPEPLQQKNELYMLNLEKKSVLVTCSSCRTPMQTRIVYRCTPRAVLLGLFLGPVAFCWVPYCIRQYEEAYHYCSVCGAYVGTSRKNY